MSDELETIEPLASGPEASARSPLSLALLAALGLSEAKVVKLSLHLDVEKPIMLEITQLVQSPESVHLERISGRYTVHATPNDDGTDPVEFEQDDPDSPLS